MTFMPRCARRSAWRWHTVSPGEAGVALRYSLVARPRARAPTVSAHVPRGVVKQKYPTWSVEVFRLDIQR